MRSENMKVSINNKLSWCVSWAEHLNVTDVWLRMYSHPSHINSFAVTDWRWPSGHNLRSDRLSLPERPAGCFITRLIYYLYKSLCLQVDVLPSRSQVASSWDQVVDTSRYPTISIGNLNLYSGCHSQLSQLPERVESVFRNSLDPVVHQ